MARKPWKSKQFFVSPWNYADEVSEGVSLPKKVQFHDITLRDGEQQSGLCFRKGEKIRIAEALGELRQLGHTGPSEIEARRPQRCEQAWGRIGHELRRVFVREGPPHLVNGSLMALLDLLQKLRHTRPLDSDHLAEGTHVAERRWQVQLADERQGALQGSGRA